jgi:hypothetical protein
MFPSARTSTLGQRALGALGLIRSFLLLENDYDVDWEVDQDEPVEVDHPHRAALRGRALAGRPARRRPGQPDPALHVCLSPVGHPAHATRRRHPRRQEPWSAEHDADASERPLRLPCGD